MLKCTFSLLLIYVATSSALYSKSSGVVDLTSSNFDNRVKDSDGVWIVEFYAPWCGHCQQLAPEYQKAAKALKGIINVGAINCDNEKSLCGQFNVQGFPTIKIFGANKKKPTDFNGQRNAAGIVQAAQSAAKKIVTERMGGGGGGSSGGGGSKNNVVELTESNFKKTVLDSGEQWLVEFFAPWCGHCKNLEPHWKRAAGQLKGKMKLGAVDATVHASLAQKYGVSGYPTIKFFKGGSVEDYDGGRTADEIVEWAEARVEQPPPEVVQAVDDKVMKENCGEKPLCVIAFLPHILDCQSKCRKAYLKTLTEAGDKFKKQGWGWIWTEGAAQTDLEAALDVGGFGYPAMTVLSVKKMKYSTLTGSFGKDGINEFLRDLSYGKGRTSAVRGAKLPALVTVDKWDGKDGKMPVEEDIDLSDVELDPLEKEEL